AVGAGVLTRPPQTVFHSWAGRPVSGPYGVTEAARFFLQGRPHVAAREPSPLGEGAERSGLRRRHTGPPALARMDFCCIVSPERGERKLPGKTENPRRSPEKGRPARVCICKRTGETLISAWSG